MAQFDPEWFMRENRTNALIAWLIVGVAIVTAIVAFVEGNVIRSGGTGLLVCISVAPSIAVGSWRRILMWPVVFLVTLPSHFIAYGPSVVADIAAAVSLATFALALVINLHLLGDVRMSTGFTAAFIVIATLGFAGFWAILMWLANIYFGTGFVNTNTDLMIDLLITTGAGLCIALGFEWYARWRIDLAQLQEF